MRAQLDQTSATGDGWRVPPPPAELFDVNEADRAWVDAQCTPQPLATFQQRLRLTGAVEAIGKVTYILASDWGAVVHRHHSRRGQGHGWRNGWSSAATT